MSEQLRKQLKDWEKKNMKGKPKKHKRSKGMTTRDIEELMGINRPTYKRKRGGAFKQK